MSERTSGDPEGNNVPIVTDPASTSTVTELNPYRRPESSSKSPSTGIATTDVIVRSSGQGHTGRALEKLRKLNPSQFSELFEDVLAELNRREARRRAMWSTGNSGHPLAPAQLLPNSNIHHRRNEARARLSDIKSKRFHMLLTDTMNEWKDRLLTSEEVDPQNEEAQNLKKSDDSDAVVREILRLREETRDDELAKTDLRQCMEWLTSEGLLGHPAGQMFQSHVGIGQDAVLDRLGYSEGIEMIGLPLSADRSMPKSLAGGFATVFRDKFATFIAITEHQEARHVKMQKLEEELKELSPADYDRVCSLQTIECADPDIVDRASKQSLLSPVDGSEWTLVDEIVGDDGPEATPP